MIEKIYISERFFTPEEIKSFKEKFAYDIKEIHYSSSNGEIDFSENEEKQFLLNKGYPMISARFFT